MGKTRAEIQKAYRERKKENDTEFLTKEKERQKKYRKHVAEMTPQEKAKKRSLNKIHCKAYRLKKKVGKNNDTNTNIASNNEPIPGTSRQKIVVKLDYHPRISKKAKRSKALKVANKKIKALENELIDLTRMKKKIQKRYERLHKKANTALNKTSTNIYESVVQTPRSKTREELRSAGVSPRLLPKRVIRKLEMSNIIAEEIKETVRKNKRTRRSVIANVIAGGVIKRYRCMRNLKRMTGMKLENLSDDKTVSVMKYRKKKKDMDELKERVVEFFERDDVSRIMPGKQDVTKVGDEKKQTRVLNDYLRSLHEKYMTENPNEKCSLATFCKLRPRHVKLTSLISRNTFLCQIHQNMALKLKCLKSYNANICANPERAGNSCTQDDMKVILEGMNVDVNADIEYDVWKRVECPDGKKRMKIVKIALKKDAFIELMVKEYTEFLGHIARVKTQYKELAAIKQNLPSDEVLVQMDFAENFTCQSLDEVQSAYWNSTCVTLHPTVVYYKDGDGSLMHRNHIFISDLLQHNANAVVAIIQKLAPIIKSDILNPEKIHYFTDSPTSQYRNRYIFDILCRHQHLFGMKAAWNYFESGHGKGPCDGLGGSAKRQASESVRQGKVHIQDAYDFYKWATTTNGHSSIQYHFYGQDDYNKAEQLLQERKVVAVPGTMKVHAAVPVSDTTIATNTVSCYCSVCLSGRLCDKGWKIHDLIGTVPEIGPGYAVDSFVIARYQGDIYVGKIIEEEDDQEVHISFMEKTTTKTGVAYKWPHPVDELWVPLCDVVMSIAPPEPVGRSMRTFKLRDNMPEVIDGV